MSQAPADEQVLLEEITGGQPFGIPGIALVVPTRLGPGEKARRIIEKNRASGLVQLCAHRAVSVRQRAIVQRLDRHLRIKIIKLGSRELVARAEHEALAGKLVEAQGERVFA